VEGNLLYIQDIKDLTTSKIGFFELDDSIMYLELYPRPSVLLPVISPQVMSILLGMEIKRVSIGALD
jgi:hypothetical protein